MQQAQLYMTVKDLRLIEELLKTELMKCERGTVQRLRTPCISSGRLLLMLTDLYIGYCSFLRTAEVSLRMSSKYAGGQC